MISEKKNSLGTFFKNEILCMSCTGKEIYSQVAKLLPKIIKTLSSLVSFLWHSNTSLVFILFIFSAMLTCRHSSSSSSWSGWMWVSYKAGEPITFEVPVLILNWIGPVNQKFRTMEWSKDRSFFFKGAFTLDVKDFSVKFRNTLLAI